MTRYYFDIEEGGIFVRDMKGVECRTKNAARRAAIDAFRRMAMDALCAQDQRVVTIAVRDEVGESVLQAFISLEVSR